MKFLAVILLYTKNRKSVCYLRREVYKKTDHHQSSTDTRHRRRAGRRGSPVDERSRHAPPRTSCRPV